VAQAVEQQRRSMTPEPLLARLEGLLLGLEEARLQVTRARLERQGQPARGHRLMAEEVQHQPVEGQLPAPLQRVAVEQHHQSLVLWA